MESPTGPPPPYEDYGPSIEVVHWTFFGLAAVAVALRVFLRTRKKDGALGWDDL